LNLRPLAAMAVLVFATHAAQAADDITTELGKCAVLKDNQIRLTCYDQLVARTKNAVTPAVVQAPAPVAAPSIAQSAPPPVAQPAVAPAAPVSVAQAPAAPPAAAPPAKEDESWFGISQWFGSTAPAQQKTPAQFGSENLPAPPPAPGVAVTEPLDSITADVSDVAFGYFGRFTVFLANGQIWQQVQGDTAVAKFSKHDKNTVTISRGAIGSYNLEIEGHTGLFKVKRLK
jgi:hypothetical protein